MTGVTLQILFGVSDLRAAADQNRHRVRQIVPRATDKDRLNGPTSVSPTTHRSSG